MDQSSGAVTIVGKGWAQIGPVFIFYFFGTAETFQLRLSGGMRWTLGLIQVVLKLDSDKRWVFAFALGRDTSRFGSIGSES
jgi:hypothetical protein